MSNRDQLQRITKQIKKKNYKAFIFFLGFTLLIWLFVQMSKSYTHILDLNFTLKDVPTDIIVDQPQKSGEIEVEQTGFKILFLSLFNSTIDLDFKALDSLSSEYVYRLKDNKAELAESLQLNVNEIRFIQDSISYEYYKLATKTLEVQSNFKVEFSKGYDSLGPFTFNPEMVKVSGKSSDLESIEFIKTKSKHFKNVLDTLQGTIKLEMPDSLPLRFFENEVHYLLPVTKFTEGSFEIPIQIQNMSTPQDIIIFPQTVNVSFKTSLSNFERIDASEFGVVAKFDPDEDFMVLELVKQPKHVKNISLDSYKVDYLIKQ